ncbi:carotenoid oxygenase family protein [Phenylobacterium sp.]|uniref:carotenoid oxygenase family protein n=1 Tax=Phenylobacterium sp. TaxID=1871053 RepID=UPI002FCAF93D
MDDLAINPYLAGNFAPLRSENDFTLEIAGEAPRDLHGRLLRIGPNPQFDPLEPFHWFTGDGMVHAFCFDDGVVTYLNRYVETPRWRLENQAGRALFASFDPSRNDPLAEGHDSGVANTSVIQHAGRLLALNESYPPFELTGEGLRPVGYLAGYGPRMTAHPKCDPVTGELHWFAYGAAGPFDPTITYGVTDRAGRTEVRKRFDAPHASMIHDFIISENYVLIPVPPLTASRERAEKGAPPIAWEPDLPTWLAVFRKDGRGEVRWFRGEAAHVFHVVNAWEEGDQIHADVFLYPSAPMFPLADGSPVKHSLARLHRWTVNCGTASDELLCQPLDDLDGEFPRLDERWTGKRHRHLWYGADTADQNKSEPIRLNSLVHLDQRLGRRTIFELPEGDLTSEPVFIPRRADAPEGDGWLSAVIWRWAENRSDLLLFNAMDVGAGPLMTARLPQRVPFGFHGTWVPG